MSKRKNYDKYNDFTTKEKDSSNSFQNYTERYNRSRRSNLHIRGSHYYKRYDHGYRRHKGMYPRHKSNRHTSRPSSPVLGTQEYMDKKIEQTSAIIMRHLLSPDEPLPTEPIQNQSTKLFSSEKPLAQEREVENTSDVQAIVNAAPRNKKKRTSKEVEEIHMKIMCHLNNLNNGRKRNLINSDNSGYDTTIQHFVKQQRLEISRALRHMCSSMQSEEGIEIINSVIPDIGIKIEDLPEDVIQELSNTFGCDFNVDHFVENSYLTDEQNDGHELNRNFGNPINNFVDSSTTQYFDIQSSIQRDEMCKDKEDLPSVPPENPANNFKELLSAGEIKVEPIFSESVNTSKDVNEKELALIKKELEEPDEKSDSVVIMREDIEANKIKDQLKEELIDEIRNIRVDHKIDEFSQNNISEDESLQKQGNNHLEKKSTYVQTELKEQPLTIDLLLEKTFENKPSCLSEAIDRMSRIDQWVLRLTKFRQKMFEEFVNVSYNKPLSSGSNSSIDNCDEIRKVTKKRKMITDDEASEDCGSDQDCIEISDEDSIEEITYDDIDDSTTSESLMNFKEIDDIIIAIEIVKDKLVAASEKGKIYICSSLDGSFLQIFSLPSSVLITSLLVVKEGLCSTNLYIGTFRDYLQVYSFHYYNFIKSIPVEDTVQCMDTKWGYIFIGCVGGWLQRYSLEESIMEYEEKFNDGTILTLKATLEGPRRILLTASEESPLCIRDAMTGLQLRVIANHINIRSMIVSKNLIYGGTSEGGILVLSFHKGTMVQVVQVSPSKSARGKICMKLYRNILFVSFLENDIHLYDVKSNKQIGDIEGPGGTIVSMEIVRNQLIVGTIEKKFKAIPIAWNSFKNR